jgi:hypothetical protein
VVSQSLVGALGVVELKVRGGEQAGEVRVVVEGLAHHYLAFCPTPVEPGRHVVVINNRGHRQVDVEPCPLADEALDGPSTERI